MINLEGFKKFIELEEERKCLEKKIKEIKAEKATLEAELIDQLENSDLDNKISLAGKTIYVKTITTASISDQQAAIELLKQTGYEYVIKEKYDIRSVGSLIKEIIEENGEELPTEWNGIIEPFFKTSLGMRAA